MAADADSVELPPTGLDLAKLTEFVDTERPGFRTGPLGAKLIAGGRSNLTYRINDDDAQWVLRRPPLGHVLETAHDMSREYRVMSALSGTSVPVPTMVAQCQNPDVMGAPFYLMEFVDGTILRDKAQLDVLGAPEADRLGEAVIETLVNLHGVEPQALGLGDFGRPDGYLRRQIERWGKQLAASKSRELPGMDKLAERLAATIPRSQRDSLVHGDYRLDNLVIDNDDLGTVRAVLDWEMATLGDPLADLASAAMWWDGIAGLDSPVAAVPGESEAFPASSQLVGRYAELTGFDLGRFNWYMGFAYYKMAAIFEGIHYRDQRGLTLGEGFGRIGDLVGTLIERGHAALDDAP